jgi:hypothetical protein
MVGLILCVFSASKYTWDSRYGEEEDVTAADAFERNRGWFAEGHATQKDATITTGCFTMKLSRGDGLNLKGSELTPLRRDFL